MLIVDVPLRTERLVLRPFTTDDLDDLHAIQSRPDVVAHLYQDVRTRDEVREVLERRVALDRLEKEGDTLVLAVRRRDGGRVIGDVVLHWASTRHRQGEIGFVFHPDDHGRGYAAEAASAVLDLGFARLGLHRVFGRADGRNTASAALMRRLGMRQEAYLVANEFVKGEWTDEVVFAVLADEWRARGSTPPAPDARAAVLDAAQRRARALAAGDAVELRRLLHPELRWTTHRGDILDGDCATLTGVAVDEVERDGARQTFRLRLSQSWVRGQDGWQCLAGHAGPAVG